MSVEYLEENKCIKEEIIDLTSDFDEEDGYYLIFHKLERINPELNASASEEVEEPEQLIFITKFQRQQIEQMLKMPQEYHSCSSGNICPTRLIERHFPTKNRKQKCVVCATSDVKRNTTYQCGECNVGLCPSPCFEIYHTKLHY